MAQAHRDDDIPHGSSTAYVNYKCRCEVCTTYRRIYLREHRRKNMQAYRDYGKRYRDGRAALAHIRMEGEFCRRLARIKEERGYTYPDMAARCGVSRTTIIGWVRGRATPLTPIKEIYRALEKESE
jgi:DNA-binding XRE family transcriptional regulator